MISVQIRLLLLFLFVLLSAMPWQKSVAAADCTGKNKILESFENGASWEMCWESRFRENLVLSDVFYKAPEQIPRRVLGSGRLSQLHVAYDDSDVTYNDVTQFGLGGAFLLELREADCPDGTLLEVQTRPAVCLWRSRGKDSYRTASRTVESESLNLFSVSQVGAYTYIVTWKFYANGTIEPQVGASGALQRNSASIDLPFGRVLEGDDETLWLSHTHNYYWRLDFDLGESGSDDVVSESLVQLLEDGTRETVEEIFTTERARRIEPSQSRAWTIWDKHPDDATAEQGLGYRIEPIRFGHRLVRDDIEPYTDYDFFVTVANDCERYASQNARFNPDCLNNVLQYANNESLVDQDIVAWHRVSFHHLPRNEDQRNMHTHWDGFAIETVNVHSNTPSLDASGNRSPEFAELSDLINVVGDSIDLHIEAFDADGDRVTLSAENLPPGLALIDEVHIHGTVEEPGLFNVRLTGSDGIDTTERDFDWTVESTAIASNSESSSFFGAVHVFLLMSLAGIFASRCRRYP